MDEVGEADLSAGQERICGKSGIMKTVADSERDRIEGSY